jgi:hypothetical protein
MDAVGCFRLSLAWLTTPTAKQQIDFLLGMACTRLGYEGTVQSSARY